MPNRTKINLVGLNREELEAELYRLGEKSFRVKQLWHWIYFRGVTNFSDMTTLSKTLRAKLADTHTIRRLDIVSEQLSRDGTRKWLLKTSDNNEVESVFIPEKKRGGRKHEWLGNSSSISSCILANY